MVNVDVFVAAIDITYNFNLDEGEAISHLIDEISEIICKKEHSKLEGKKEHFLMGSIDKQMNFNSKNSLKNYSVKNGETLILV